VHNDPSVADFWHSRKCVMACLLVLIGNESNLGPILQSFINFVQRKPLFAVPQPYLSQFQGVLLE